MGFIIGLLTFVLVLDCLVLVLLVLVQLPKKEAGAGLAFGGAATDALFGAGSGNVLTKVTKYAATIFFVLAVFLSLLQSRYYHRTGNLLLKLAAPTAMPSLPGATPSVPSATPVAPLLGTNALRSAVEETNMPAPPPATPPANATAPTNAARQK
ncbi:MAG TPA: preprotein translocase subunit SecG [Candidatus Binatia bacterium]|jgi:preprotein translocase subunit SecG|nr:preprotein translocase subunit SecG [Candidatus Binatia bacterium]